jgi:acetate kinase
MEENRVQRKDAGQFDVETVRKISAEKSVITVYVVPAEEDLMIARHVARMCGVSLPSEV